MRNLPLSARLISVVAVFLLLGNCAHSKKMQLYPQDLYSEANYFFEIMDYENGLGEMVLSAPNGELFAGKITDDRKVMTALLSVGPANTWSDTQSLWWAPLGENPGNFKAHLTAVDKRTKMTCYFIPTSGRELTDSGTANCYRTDGRWLIFEYPGHSLNVGSHQDWSSYDAMVWTYKSAYQPIPSQQVNLASTLENIEQRYGKIAGKYGYTLEEAVLITQHAIIDKANYIDIWAPYLNSMNDKTWQILYFAKPFEVMNTYRRKPGSSIIIGTEFVLRKENAEMHAGVNDQGPPLVHAKDRYFSTGGVSMRSSFKKTYTPVLF